MLTGSVTHNFQNWRYFQGPVWKLIKLIKSKLTQKLKHANSILEYFEYLCQISSKSIIIISSYTVSKFVRFFETQCSISMLPPTGRAPQRLSFLRIELQLIRPHPTLKIVDAPRYFRWEVINMFCYNYLKSWSSHISIYTIFAKVMGKTIEAPFLTHRLYMRSTSIP